MTTPQRTKLVCQDDPPACGLQEKMEAACRNRSD